MNESRAARLGRLLRSTRTRALLSLGLVLGLTSVSTLAYWTDEAQLTTGSIQSGSLDLLILDGRLEGQGGAVTDTAMSASSLIPGETFAFTVPVQRKANTAGFSLTATATAAGTASPHLQWAVFEGTAGTQVTNANGIRTNTCSGTQLSAGVTLDATVKSVISSSAPVNLGGSTYSKNLCFRVTMPTTTGNGAQSTSGTATFTFSASQLQ
ncbi:MAG: SipW-dependent-type signal peptide-containing protein [Aeromicrobium sp.]